MNSKVSFDVLYDDLVEFPNTEAVLELSPVDSESSQFRLTVNGKPVTTFPRIVRGEQDVALPDQIVVTVEYGHDQRGESDRIVVGFDLAGRFYEADVPFDIAEQFLTRNEDGEDCDIVPPFELDAEVRDNAQAFA